MRLLARTRSVRCAVAVALVGAALALGLAGCGGATRSVASFCSYLYGQGGRLRSQWIQADQKDSQEPLTGLATAFAAVPELAAFMHQLSLRAPAEVQPDVEVLASSFQHAAEQESSEASDPLGAMAGGLVDALQASGAEQHFNAYVQGHCGPPPGAS